MLEVKGVSKAFETPVLTGFDLTVDAGEIVALLGPSGSGKSTLLRIICGLETPDAGSVHLPGVDITSQAPESRGIGLVFQNLALFPHLSVAGNIGFGLPKGTDVATIDEMLDRVGLAGFGDRSIDALSGGEAQRVALARALVAQPRMILLDEPLSSLDAELKARLAQSVRDLLKQAEIPAIHVTHDPEIAAVLADRIVRF